MAEAGAQRVTNRNVLDFVDFQSTSASNAKANVGSIASELGITAEDSPFVSSIAASSAAQMSALRETADTGFDDAFLISVADAQSFAAATFADSFAGSGNSRIASLVNDMHDALELEAGFSRALQGDFDATDFLMNHQEISTSGSASGAGSSGSGVDTGGAATPETGTVDPGSGGTTTPGSGSGSDGGLGGEGTATGNGADPGGAVGTGTPNDDGDPTTP